MALQEQEVKQSDRKSSQNYNDFIFQIFEVFREERRFLLFIGLLFLIAGIVYTDPKLAMWFGFTLAAFAAVSNDSIQTIGTFIASNYHRKWWVLWLFIGGIFVATAITGYVLYDGDVSFQRLQKTENDGTLSFPQPDNFAFLQIGAPIFLLILTRFRIPVSTSFLLISCFAASPSAVGAVLNKSITAYFIAFALGMIVWLSISRISQKYFTGKAPAIWVVAQWLTSGTLWSVWIMHDISNIAVYLPRQLNLGSFIAFTAIITLGLGLLFFLRGDKIQKIVNEKSEVRDIRAATIIDFVYAIILIYKLLGSQVPMSTTWAFIGLLGGRELAMRLRLDKDNVSGAGRMIVRDASRALFGLVISIAIAMAVNPRFRDEMMSLFN